MLNKPDLTSGFCIYAVVNATPYPSRYKPGTPDTTRLFDLGVVDDVQAAHFITGVKTLISPWRIDDSKIASSGDTTVQDAAASVMNNAY
jgi:hypothetical protein